MPGKQKYLAIILFEADSEQDDYRPLYEESFVEILASTIQEAKKIALAFSQKRETSYKNVYGDKVSWRLRKVIDVSETLETKAHDGACELYSRHFYDIKSYEKFETLSR